MRGDPISRPEDIRWLADYPRHGAARCPERIAIIGDGGTFTYAELDLACVRFADWLLRSGIGAGQRIAYLGKNNPLFFPVLFGCMRAGVVLVPINWRCAVVETNFILADADAKLLICDPEFLDSAQQAMQDLTAPPSLITNEPCAAMPMSLRAILNESTPVAPLPSFNPDACVLQMYTSGTTGKPKGVMMSQRALSIQRWVEVDSPEWADWTDDDVILSAMPNFHIGGLSWMLIGLLRSLTCVLTADASPSNLLALTQRHGVTRTFVVPAALPILLDMVADCSEPPRMKGIFYGAAPMNTSLLKRCIDTFACRFGQFYGMTENCGSVTFLGPDSHDLSRPELLRSVGKVLPGMEIEIRDVDLRSCPPDVAGEIWLRGPALMLGYHNRPEASAEVMIDGWYRSGDGGYFDQNGYLFLTDRIKDVIISGGENIYPIEVENSLRLHDAVRDVVVIGQPDPQWGEAVAAVVEWHDGKSATLDELRAHCRKLIAGFKLPKQLYTMPLLPRTATGKLQRGEVRKRFSAPLSN